MFRDAIFSRDLARVMLDDTGNVITHYKKHIIAPVKLYPDLLDKEGKHCAIEAINFIFYRNKQIEYVLRIKICCLSKKFFCFFTLFQFNMPEI